MAAPQLPTMGKWSTGICGCFEDCTNCCVTCVCPILTFARNAEIVDEGRTTPCTAGLKYVLFQFCLPVLGTTLYRCTYRTKLRHHFQLPEQPCEPCGDCCVHLLCCCCALCQEHRELKNRQMDPAGGWRKAYEAIMAPSGAAPILNRAWLVIRAFMHGSLFCIHDSSHLC